MPIYEFHCKQCRKDFKTLRSASQLDKVSCPACESPKVARLLSVTAQPVSQSASPADAACAMGAGCCGGGCGLRN